MEIITKGLFKFDPKKTYVLIDSLKNEHGSIEVIGEKIGIHLHNPVSSEDEDYIEFFNSESLENFLNEKEYIITSDSPRWINYNPNPSDTNKANDCSIRAYCAAENIEWEKAFDVAAEYAREVHYMPNDSLTCKKIMEEGFGYDYVKLPKEQKGMLVQEFAINYPEGTYVLNCPSHFVTVINGEYYDSWDSGKKKVKGYYVKRNNN